MSNNKLRFTKFMMGTTALVAFCLPAQAQPQVTNPETVVITGTKTGDFGEKSGIPIEQVPQSIQVVDQED